MKKKRNLQNKCCFIKLMLTQLLIEKEVITEEQHDDLPENIQFFMDNIKTSYDTDRLEGEELCDSTRRYKVNIITQVLRERNRTGTSADCFYDDKKEELGAFRQINTDETSRMTIGDENDFSTQLTTMNALIQAGRDQTALHPDSKHSIEDMTTGVFREGLDGTPPSETSQLESKGQEITSSPSSSSTCAAFFKKKASTFMAVALFGSFSSLGILAYLQYHGPDGKSFLDGLKDIPNNASMLGLAIFGGVCIALLIATAVAACRSGSETGYTPLPQRTGGQ